MSPRIEATAIEASRPRISNRLLSVLSRWKLILAGACAGGVIGILACVFQTPIYTAEVTILPSARGAGTGLLGQFASLAGATLPDDSGQWEDLFGRIAVSDGVIDALADRKWDFAESGTPVPLEEIFDIPLRSGSANPVAEQRERVREVIRQQVIRFHRDKFTGYMVLQVRAPEDARFAAELANSLTVELEAAVGRLRANRDADQRQFLEMRVAEIKSALTAASNELTEFVAANRSYYESPSLVQRYGELEREVQAQTSLWIEMRRQLELARIEEVRDPVDVNVLDRAEPPLVQSSPRLVLSVAIFGLLGLLAGAAIHFGLAILGSRDT